MPTFFLRLARLAVVGSPLAMTALNPAQRAAVEHEKGPLLVLAGAGSGKTRVITHRIAYLIKHGVPPDSILAVSFTNKAAAEMRERLCKLISPSASAKLWLSTFHSFGLRFLEKEIQTLGYGKRFVVFDQGDSLGIVRDILKDIHHRGLDAGAILARISNWKNAFVSPDLITESEVEYDEVARETYPLYENTLRQMHAVDFDDLVVLPTRILRENSTVQKRWQKRFRHLLIDEFQDTNRSQLELTKALSNKENNVCVVGDDDQSIYAWRGADIRNILEFDKHYPGTTIVKLEDNYRSCAPILELANAAIAESGAKRHAKVLRAKRGSGDKVRHHVSSCPEEEAKFVAAETRRLREKGILLKDVAVLYRSNSQARLIEEELRAQGLGYRMLGGTQFFERKEVKDAIAYLRTVLYPNDELSLRRIINYPPRAIGDQTLNRLTSFANNAGIGFTKAFTSIEKISDIPGPALQSALHLRGALNEARKAFRSGHGLAQHARILLDKVGLTREFLDGGNEKSIRYQNIEALFHSLARYEREPEKTAPSLGAFLSRITLRSENEDTTPSNVVTLSTLHAAKGLEFKVVFLIGCVEGQLPHNRILTPQAHDASNPEIEEERRLFYVGITRTKDQLYLSSYKQRTLRGRVTLFAPSRFLEGLPETSLEEYEPHETQVADFDEVQNMVGDLLSRLDH